MLGACEGAYSYPPLPYVFVDAHLHLCRMIHVTTENTALCHVSIVAVNNNNKDSLRVALVAQQLLDGFTMVPNRATLTSRRDPTYPLYRRRLRGSWCPKKYERDHRRA